MNKSTLLKLKVGIATAACSLMAIGCAVEATGPDGGVVYADAAPPPIVDEAVPVSPGGDAVWIGGSWGWSGHRWDWEKGRWAAPPHAGAHWEPNHYAYKNGRHTYTKGRWH
ncbi:MAG TPA: hypothetical protein VGO67_01505 [Verrucomicrobiae bacterium]